MEKSLRAKYSLPSRYGDVFLARNQAIAQAITDASRRNKSIAPMRISKARHSLKDLWKELSGTRFWSRSKNFRQELPELSSGTQIRSMVRRVALTLAVSYFFTVSLA